MSRECATFYSHAAELLAEKRNIPRSTASCWSRPDAFIAVKESDIGIVTKESNMKMT